MTTNKIIQKLRQSRGLTQSEMAVEFNVSLSAYQKYERDKNPLMPSLDVLTKMADYFHTTVDYLLGRDTGEPEPLDSLAEQFHMSALEKKIVEGYLELPKNLRGDLMEFLEKSVREVMDEGGE